MLVTVIKVLFLISAIIFASMIVYGKIFVFKKKHPAFVSDYCATIAGVLGVYSLLALALVWGFPSTSEKLIMFLFALSPFIIGLLTSYHTEKYYTAVQVFVIIVSILFVL